MRLFLLFLLFSCASTSKPEPQGPHCYLFLGSQVVKIKTEGSSAYLFSIINQQETFYWEELSYIQNYYLPEACDHELVKRALSRL